MSGGSGRRVISGNGLPVGQPTATYPIRSGDPAYQIDRNPNSITCALMEIPLPLNPAPASTATCLSLGTIAVALTGVSVFNALDGGGRDTPAYEVLDISPVIRRVTTGTITTGPAPASRRRTP